MNKLLTIVFLLIFCSVESQNVKGVAVDAYTQEKIPYVNIFAKKISNIGSTTDGEGFFNFHIAESLFGEEFVFSALGYEKTIVRFDKNIQDLEVKMKPIIYNLGEVKVEAKATYEKLLYGSFDYKIDSNEKGETIGEPLEKKAIFGVFVKSSSRAILRKFSFYVADIGKLNSTFVMRIIGFDKKKKIKSAYMNKFTDSYDVIQKPIVFTASKRGWNTIEFSNNDDLIILPKEPFLIYIYQVDKGNHLVWENEERNYNYYGSVIANYARFSTSKMIEAYIEEGYTYPFFGYFRTKPTPAIVLECDKIK